jgi:hypothetical protein
MIQRQVFNIENIISIVMITIIIIVFIIDAVCSAIMLYKSKRLYKKNNKVYCKNYFVLMSYFGATMGILFWSYVIGFTISIFTDDFYRLMFSAFIGSAISLLPCIKGLNKTFSIKI